MSLNRGGALWINLGRPTKEKGRGTTPDPPAHGLCTVQIEVCSALLQKQPGFTSLQVPGPITSSRTERRVCTASLGADPVQLEDQGHFHGGVQAVVPLIPISSDASFQGMQRLIDPNTMPQGRQRGDKTPPSL